MTATRTITLTFDVAARTEGELPTPDLLREGIQHDLDLHAVARADEHWITAISVPPQPAGDDRLRAACYTILEAADALQAVIGQPPAPPMSDAEAIKQGELLRQGLSKIDPDADEVYFSKRERDNLGKPPA